MAKKPDFMIRAMAARHCKEVARLTYDAFPFEKANDSTQLGPNRDLAEELKKTVGPWNGTRHLVAVDKKDKVLGFVAVRWLKAEEERVSTGVLTMPRLVVAERDRARGIGSALLRKIVESAGVLGYGEVMATIPDSLADWYSSQGWTVFHPGDVYVLLEQPHLGDDRDLPEPPPAGLRGKFSPFQLQEPGPVEHGYTRIACRRTGAESTLITSWSFTASDSSPMQGLWRTLIRDPQLIPQVPFLTASILLAEMENDPAVKKEEWALFSSILAAGLTV